jgi:ribosomal protein S13
MLAESMQSEAAEGEYGVMDLLLLTFNNAVTQMAEDKAAMLSKLADMMAISEAMGDYLKGLVGSSANLQEQIQTTISDYGAGVLVRDMVDLGATPANAATAITEILGMTKQEAASAVILSGIDGIVGASILKETGCSSDEVYSALVEMGVQQLEDSIHALRVAQFLATDIYLTLKNSAGQSTGNAYSAMLAESMQTEAAEGEYGIMDLLLLTFGNAVTQMAEDKAAMLSKLAEMMDIAEAMGDYMKNLVGTSANLQEQIQSTVSEYGGGVLVRDMVNLGATPATAATAITGILGMTKQQATDAVTSSGIAGDVSASILKEVGCTSDEVYTALVDMGVQELEDSVHALWAAGFDISAVYATLRTSSGHSLSERTSAALAAGYDATDLYVLVLQDWASGFSSADVSNALSELPLFIDHTQVTDEFVNGIDAMALAAQEFLTAFDVLGQHRVMSDYSNAIAQGFRDLVDSSQSGNLRTAFENFDQKADELYNVLSTVMKNQEEMESGIQRNIL